MDRNAGNRKVDNELLALTAAVPLEAEDREAQKREKVSRWLSNLNEKKLDKLISLAGLVDDEDVCERIPPPEFVAGGGGVEPHVRVTWEEEDK